MTKTTLLTAAAILLAATATSASAAGIVGDDYSRYASVEGPNAPLLQSFAPNRDDARLTDVYGPYDYLFLLHDELEPNAVRTASNSSPVALDPRS